MAAWRALTPISDLAVLFANRDLRHVVLSDRALSRTTHDSESIGGDHVRQRAPMYRKLRQIKPAA